MKIRQPRLHLSRPLTAVFAVTSIFVVSGVFAGVILHAHADAICSNLWSSAESGDNVSVTDALEKGADPNCQCGEPMKRAKSAGHPDTINLLKRYGAKE